MNDTFALIKEQFRRRCGADLAWLRRGLTEPAELTDPKFQMMIHRLAGMAGTMGFHDLSRFAAEMDDALLTGSTPNPDDLRRLETALSEIAVPSAGVSENGL
jgi:HPt (histidine-containing phosphotransfer) domain-containing protein